MRTFLIEVFNIFSVYEAILLVTMLLIPAAGLATYAHYKTRSKRLDLLLLLAVLGQLIAFTISVLGIQFLTDTVTNGFMQISFYLLVIVNLINLTQLLTYYINEMGEKRFDPDHITRAHFKTSLDTFIVVTIILAAALIFSPQTFQITLALSILSIMLTLIFNHFIARRILKDNQTE